MRSSSGRLKRLMEQSGREHFPKPDLITGSTKLSGKPLRVLVADDQLLVRAGICELVNLLPGVHVVAQASDGLEALRLIESQHADIVLMDLAMPGMNGLEATVLAKKQFPHVKIIILSDFPSEEFVARALRSGAEGLVLKEDSVEELYSAIKSVAEGAEHLSPKVTGKVVQGYLRNQSQPGVEKSVKLTPRQSEMLQLIAEGKSTKEIASLLRISINTVKTHRLKLMEKLGAHEITSVVRYALKLGLLKSNVILLVLLPLLLTHFS